MEFYLWTIIFVIGACVGSFINMLVYRTSVRYELKQETRNRNRKKNVNKKRSFCDFCGRQLSWYENIPVMSWMMQGGKTRCCGKKLPLSYPVVEVVTGTLFLITAIINQNIQNANYTPLSLLILVIELVIVTMLVFEAEFDRQYMILPDFGIIIMCVSTLVLWILSEITGGSQISVLNYLLSAFGAFGFLLFLHVVTKGKGMGMGDVKLAVFMGLLLASPKVVMAFYVAFIVGAVYGLIMMALKKVGKKSVIPFGPFLILGTLAAWWWGDWMIKILDSRF